MRIAILGGAGLLGSELCTKLSAQGHEVAIVDNFSGSLLLRVPTGRKVFAQDVTNLNSLTYAFKVFKPEIVFVAINFFYNYGDNDYKIYDETKTILNTANNLVALLDSSVKEVYYCSSSEVYGVPRAKKPVKENRKITSSSNLRGVAFKSSEDIISFRCNQLGIRFVSFRVFDLYGPRIKFTPITGTINFLISSFKSFEQIGLSDYLDKRDFVYYKDAVDIMCATMMSDFSGVMNVGSGVPITLLDICKIIDKHIKIVEPPIAVDTGKGLSCVADLSLCQSITGIKPKILVSDKISELIEFRKKEEEFYSSSNSAAVLRAQRGL
jgi:nucleoside-diphosphate-sugar epimerase